jgi:spermidine synthase
MTSPQRPSPLVPFLIAAACSGCAALLNQVMWSRILSLVFGSTIEAVSAVTAIFMAGLALGSALAPRLVVHRSAGEAAALYSRVELAIGGVAVLLAFVLPALEPVRASVGAGPLWFLAILLLLVPAGLMGTTLVIQSHVVSSSVDHARGSRTAGLLFAANTFGAVVGAYGSVMVLVPALGVRKTIIVATVLNLVAAGLGRMGARANAAASNPGKPVPVSASPSSAPVSRLSVLLVMLALFTAGFAGLANEVAWTRAFILVAGPTVHAFAFVLGAIVLGLAAGALVSSSLLPYLGNPRLAFVVVQAAVAIASAHVIRTLASMPLAYGEEVRRLIDQPEAIVGLQASRSLFLLFPAAALSGALFPLGLRLLRSRFSMPQAMGFGSALNTLGAILGASLAGFVLLPGLGLDLTLRLAAAGSALSALLVALHCRLPSRIAGVTASLLAFGLLFTAPTFDKELFAGGVYKYSAYDPELSVEDVLRRGELVSYAEGRASNVSVKRIGASFSLAVDGKVDATSGGDMLTQRLLAHVPFLISEKPGNALVIGLGSGVTAAAALTHEPLSVTAVEISPEVVGAAREFFGEANRRVLEDPRLRLVVGDARQHVLAEPDRYDVIISEPSNPWMAGVSALFTREFFTAVRSRLVDGGVFCQWGHLYNMSESDLKTLLATFGDVFPHASVYVISEADILIVGRDGSSALSPARLEGMTSAARLDLAASNLTADSLASIPTVALDKLGDWLRDARRHTDDAPVLDFSAPLSIHAQTASTNRRRLIPEDAPGTLAALRARLILLGASGSSEWAYEVAERAISMGISDREIGLEYVKGAVRLRRVESAETTLSAAIARAPSSPLYVTQALLYWNTGRADRALQSLEAASRLDPLDPSAYLLGAEIQSGAGNLQAMRRLIARVLSVDGRNVEALGLAAEAELKDGRLEPAARLAEGALGIDPGESRALEVHALALARLGRLAEARNAFLTLLRASPEAPVSRNNFGVFELQQGNAAAAARLFKDAVDLDPSNLDGYRGLKEAATLLQRNDLLQFAERGIGRLTR